MNQLYGSRNSHVDSCYYSRELLSGCSFEGRTTANLLDTYAFSFLPCNQDFVLILPIAKVVDIH